MSYHTRVVRLNEGGSAYVNIAPGRIAAIDAHDGSVPIVLLNRGNTFAEGDRLPEEEEFVEGRCVFTGQPNTRAVAHFRF